MEEQPYVTWAGTSDVYSEEHCLLFPGIGKVAGGHGDRESNISSWAKLAYTAIGNWLKGRGATKMMSGAKTFTAPRYVPHY